MASTLGTLSIASVKEEDLCHAQAPSVEYSAHGRQNGGDILEMEVEKNTGAENGSCILAMEQLGCTPGSHLAAWLDAVVFARQRGSVLNYIQPLGQHS